MKFKEEIRKRLVDHTVDGVTHQIAQPYRVKVPVLPADWDGRAMKAVSTLVLALTGIAIVWSTVSIGQLLQGGPGYAAAALFDISWLSVLLLEWMARFDPSKRKFARTMGFLLVGITAAAIFWHGMLAGSVALAVVGAMVSVIAKALWMAVFKHVDRELSPEDRQWVAAEMSKANAKIAIAGVRRQAAAAEVRARLEILAAEKALGELDEQDANTAEHEVEQAPARVALSSANTVREPAAEVLSIAELARQQVAAGASNQQAADEILRRLPGANVKSVEATVRREARRLTRYM
ncbi:hypothetical protein [Streptomyces sp. MK7]|uniref:hypothetical protein n=1 Tax=Streptomyces sp. MK7 TaxID=3067635 RepID=UPI00292D0E6A|nr:hypothetical protein [Streptomyces sp. MK7]